MENRRFKSAHGTNSNNGSDCERVSLSDCKPDVSDTVGSSPTWSTNFCIDIAKLVMLIGVLSKLDSIGNVGSTPTTEFNFNWPIVQRLGHWSDKPEI